MAVYKGSTKVAGTGLPGAAGLTQANVLSIFYPVGTIYQSVNNVNPGTFMGGTWVAWGSGKVPFGVDTGQTEFDTVEETGGAKTVTLTSSEMPSHTHTQDAHTHTQNAHAHSVRYKGFDVVAGSPGFYCLRRQDAADSYDGTDTDAAIAATAVNQNATATNQNTGGGGAHNNLPPYITCYYWKRTA